MFFQKGANNEEKKFMNAQKIEKFVGFLVLLHLIDDDPPKIDEEF
jgi:hypothetical protein